MLPRILHHRPSIPRLYSQVAAAAAVLKKSPTQEHQQIPHTQLTSQKCIREQLRELLRETAQPVAVITAFMPPSSSHKNLSDKALHHGATLSSFTSIAMDPYPLVTFALRIPSRMATTLNSTTLLPSSMPDDGSEPPSQMVINILSSTQAKHALVFSRPDLYLTPFTDPDISYKLSDEGLPVFEGSLGAMSCRLVGRGIPLHDMGYLGRATSDGSESMNEYWEEGTGNTIGGGIPCPKARQPAVLQKGAPVSELFIAQVTRIEALASTPTLPLLYHRRKFTSCIPCPPDRLP